MTSYTIDELNNKLRELEFKIANLEGQVLILKELLDKKDHYQPYQPIPWSPTSVPYTPNTPWYSVCGGNGSMCQR